MDKKIAIELIKLEVLNRCSHEDIEALQFLKRNDEDFPWKEHGDYQNLMAVLSIRPTSEMPRESLKYEIIKKASELKNISIPENNSRELKTIVEESVTVSLHEFESTEPGILPKFETSVAGIPLLEKDNEAEEYIDEGKDECYEFVTESEKIARALDDFILQKQPDLFKFRDTRDSTSREEIEDIEKIEEIEKVEEIEEEKQVLNQTINEIDLENSLDIKVKSISNKDEETEISEENIQPVSEPVIIFEKSSDEKEISGYVNKKRSSKRNSKSNLIIVIALIVIVIPMVVFLSSSNEEVKGEIEKPLNNKSIVSSVELSKSTDNGIEKVEDVPKVDENNSVKETQSKKTNQPPPLPEPVFVEAKGLDVIEEKQNNNVEKKENPKVELPQVEKTIENEPAFFIAVEEMPEPLRGISEIQRRVVYPRIASLSGVEGKVIIQAIVDEAGNVTNAEIVKGIGSGCDEAALKAIFETKFKPGKQRGKAVKVRVTIPIVFKKS